MPDPAAVPSPDAIAVASPGATASYLVRTLDVGTWDAFAELVERNNGIFGGCWCIGYHPECGQNRISYRETKQDLVRTGRAHAALVLDSGGAAQGWCQYGSPEELPNIKHRREYAWIVSRVVEPA